MSSTTRQITLSQTDENQWIASDEETGVTSEGASIGAALVGLGLKLESVDSESSLDELLDALLDAFETDDRRQDLEALSERVQRRFEGADVTDEDVEDAIEWARSQ